MSANERKNMGETTVGKLDVIREVDINKKSEITKA
jgi:hypothetical protein